MPGHPTPRWQIEITDGPAAGEVVPVGGHSVTIGRAPGNAVCLQSDSGVSKHHAVLSYDGVGWRVADLGSKNGTFLVKTDGQQEKVIGTQVLSAGCTVLTGRTHLRVAAQPLSEPETAGDTLVLRIEREEEALRFHVLGNAAYSTRHSVAFNRHDLEELDVLMRQLAVMDHRGREENRDTLSRVGTYLRNHLLPHSIRRKLEEAEQENLLLVLHPDLLCIPWELALINERYVARKFAVGRQILVDDFQSHIRLPAPANKPNLLMIVDPTGDLAEVEESAAQCYEHLVERGACADITFLAGPRAQRLELLDRMGRADIIYYTGHAVFDEAHPEQSGWVLHEGRLTCADIARLSTPPRLVLANACSSGREAPWHSRTVVRPGARGMAGAFVLTGVEHFVATLWPIPADSAARFGKTFLDASLQGFSIGLAFHQGRESLIQLDGPSHPAWAAYLLYGDPAAKLA